MAKGEQLKYEANRDHIIEVYRSTKGRKPGSHSCNRAAKQLGMPEASLRSKLQKWGILPWPPYRKMPVSDSQRQDGSHAAQEVSDLLAQLRDKRIILEAELNSLVSAIAAVEMTVKMLEVPE